MQIDRTMANDEINSVDVMELPGPQKKRSPTKLSWIRRRVFILSWITCYDRDMAMADLIAGITLGLTMIPQSIAYATLAGLPSQYGLYSAFVGSLIYVVFGSIKEVSIGPTSLMALLTLHYTMDKPIGFAIVLAFLAGCVEFLMGALKLGFLVDFISAPVTSAFTSATSLIIINSQLKDLFGLTFKAKGFMLTLWNSLASVPQLKWTDTVLGLFCVVFLLALRAIKDISFKKSRYVLKKAMWYLSISRNALVVIITFGLSFAIASRSELGEVPFRLSGKLEAGIPSFRLPPLSIQYENKTLGLLEICAELGTGIIVVPLVAVLANVAIAKSFTSGALVDASQEMLTLGICNILGSCFLSMPTCGAFTRSAVSQASGVRTPLAGLYSGLMTLIALSLLTPYFYFIPKATLAAILICAVFFMMDFKIAMHLWSNNRKDFNAWLICFVVSVTFGVELGLLSGIIVSVINLIAMSARPDTSVTTRELDSSDYRIKYIHIAPNGGAVFPGIDYFRNIINKACIANNFELPVVIECGKFTEIDYSAYKGIFQMAADLKKRNTILVMHNLDDNLQSALTELASLQLSNREKTLEEILLQNIKELEQHTAAITPLIDTKL